MDKVVGILLKGDPYNRQRPFDSLNYIWLTQRQFNQMMAEQETHRGKSYWIDNRVFRLSEVAIAQEFDIDELKRRNQLKPYLEEALREEQAGSAIQTRGMLANANE